MDLTKIKFIFFRKLGGENFIMFKLIHGDCTKELEKLIKNNIKVDLTITSPPYDNLRNYNNNLKWDFPTFKKIADQLYEITINGGVVVWIVNDAVINGSETGTSFKQALYFKEIGFNLHDTMIYAKNNPVPNAKTRYQQGFEYMFVFSKGKPKTTNILYEPRHNKYDDKRTFRQDKQFNRTFKGEHLRRNYKYKENVPKRNIWYYSLGLNGTTRYKDAFNHPAIFPEKLAKDHILSWSNPGDLVLDPFMGSGTVGVMCLENNREFIGVEIVEEYYNIALKRCKEYQSKLI